MKMTKKPWRAGLALGCCQKGLSVRLVETLRLHLLGLRLFDTLGETETRKGEPATVLCTGSSTGHPSCSKFFLFSVLVMGHRPEDGNGGDD